MTDGTDFFVQTLITRVANDCSSARARIRVATDMRHVKHASDVHTNPMIRALPQVRQDVRSVHDAAEKRMDALLDQQLQKMAACATGDEIRAEHARLLRNDWCFLRGDFSRIYQRADREYLRLLHRAERQPAPAAPLEDQEPAADDEEGLAPAP
ncbi:hypothetical protein ACFPOU_07665 [Massilia jejuensis]|uniref:Uncharacterized protein n=1 Tax=Massilia jejuensis TaxID=648894 RepID=A0ABW0PET7_9BURK